MAATPKPVRKYEEKIRKEYKKKFPSLGMHKTSKKETAKANNEKGLVSKKGKPHVPKMKHGVFKGVL